MKGAAIQTDHQVFGGFVVSLDPKHATSDIFIGMSFNKLLQSMNRSGQRDLFALLFVQQMACHE